MAVSLQFKCLSLLSYFASTTSGSQDTPDLQPKLETSYGFKLRGKWSVEDIKPKMYDVTNKGYVYLCFVPVVMVPLLLVGI